MSILEYGPRGKRLLRADLDVMLALIGLLVAVMATLYSALVLQRTVYVIFGLSLAGTCSSWFLIRRRTVHGWDCGERRTAFTGLASVSFLILSSSLIVLYLRPELYGRPIAYFILLAAMAGTIALQVFVLPPGRTFVVLVLLQLLALGISMAYSQLLLFPDVVGVDPAIHQGLVRGIIANGEVTPGADYSTTPLFQIVLASGSLVTGLDYRSSAAFIISSIVVLVTTLAVFLLGKHLFNEKVGLLAGLMLTVAPYHIYFSVWLVPNALAVISVPLILYILYKIRRTESGAGLGLVALLMIALILTHPVASLGLAIILPIIWSVYALYNHLTTRKEVTPVTYRMALFFAVVMLGWWSYYGHQIDFIANQISGGFEIEYLSGIPTVIADFVYTISITEQVFRYLGMIVFFAICLIGCLYVVSKRNRNLGRTSIVAVGLLSAGIGFVSLALALTGLDARWFYLAEVLLAIPAAVFFFSAFSRKKLRPVSAVAVFLLILSVAFFAMASPSGSIDNRDMFPNTGVRFAFTESEIVGASYAAKATAPEGNISSDFDFATDVSSSVFINHLGVDPIRIVSLDEELLYGNFSRDNSLKVIRGEAAEGPIRLYALPYRLDYDPRISLARSDLHKVYDSGPVSAYY